MPWFVAKRALVENGEATDKYEYRVVSEAEIETIEPDWEWASSACDSLEDAYALADEQFLDDLE